LDAVRAAAADAFEKYSAAPSARLLSGYPLSREEYYSVAAVAGPVMTQARLGLSDLEDYQVFCFMCYEDADWRGYINPALEPRDPQSRLIGARFGRPPEECYENALRADQREFFQERLPAVYKRFKRS